jgi:hypothetical protein
MFKEANATFILSLGVILQGILLLSFVFSEQRIKARVEALEDQAAQRHYEIKKLQEARK